jgi:polyferredoxin
MNPDRDDPEAHVAWLRREIEWQKKNLEGVDNDRKKAPFLLLGLVLAIPVGIIWSWVHAVLVVIGTFALLTSAYYLTAGHRSEYLQKIAGLESELREAERRRRG